MNSIVCQKMQNWLFSYLQNTVMDLRETVNNLTQELKTTKNQLNKLNEKVIESTPVGSIAYFTDTTAPLGWLKANGQVVSRISFSNLFAKIGTRFGSGDGSTTFTLPDLRGEFIRGWSDGRDVDKDRGFGSFQWGSSIPLALYINGECCSSHTASNQGRWAFSGATFDEGYETNIPNGQTRVGVTFPTEEESTYVGYMKHTNEGNITHWNLMKGTRPRNIALLACIKY